MGKYFGTDGVRGRANEDLTVQMAVKIGQFLGWYFKDVDKPTKILIGKDTRISSDMFESALAAGAASCGASVYLLGVCPTPSVSYLIKNENFDCGVMISASHNPYYDNGIKLFNNQGCKMNPEVELMIEDYIDEKTFIPLSKDMELGKVLHWEEGLELYKKWMISSIQVDLTGKKIVLDLANGSTTTSAYDIFKALNADVTCISNQPNGININNKCGSTKPEAIQSLMREGNYDCGFAYDGDGDRLIAIDEDGNLIDGDHVMYICGKNMKKHGELKDNMVVTTVMSNLGLYKAFEKEGIISEKCKVGDKYVFECMVENGYSLGGEQSGHILFMKHLNTGDGVLTSLKLCEVMVEENKSLKQLKEGLFIYPQLLKNTTVKDKNYILSNKRLWDEVRLVEEELKDEGRILVRPSGTEPLIRVMVEAKSDELCKQYVEQIIKIIIELENNA